MTQLPTGWALAHRWRTCGRRGSTDGTSGSKPSPDAGDITWLGHAMIRPSGTLDDGHAGDGLAATVRQSRCDVTASALLVQSGDGPESRRMGESASVRLSGTRHWPLHAVLRLTRRS